MNQKFQAYVTQVAFSLTLSKRMVDVILMLELERIGEIILLSHCVPTCYALSRRGLAEYPVLGGPKLTDEGKLVAQLLKKAGYSISASQDKAA